MGNSTGSTMYMFGAVIIIYIVGMLIYQGFQWLRKKRQQKKIFKKRTGITAFLSKEIFFTTSYNPNKVAETKASNNHIVSNINLSTIQFYKVGYASLRQSILRKKRKRFTACPNRRTIISALPMRYRNPTPASFIYKQDVYQKSGAKIK